MLFRSFHDFEQTMIKFEMSIDVDSINDTKEKRNFSHYAKSELNTTINYMTN